MNYFAAIRLPLCLSLVLGILSTLTRGDQPQELHLHSFERKTLTDVYFSEGAGAGDINGDGVDDVVYGPYWFAGPDYTTKFEIDAPQPQDVNKYADKFFSWVYDFNGDGANDVLMVGLPGSPAFLYENPGVQGLGSHWKKHQVFNGVNNESPQLVNIVGDTRPELVCTHDGFFGFVSVNPTDPFGTWTFHAVSEKGETGRFLHGLGVGDVNGDGRLDILHAGGWMQQPETSPETTRWIPHDVSFSTGAGGADMFAYDVDRDGDNDIITSHSAHAFGLGWYEQIRNGDEIAFKHHLIMGSQPSENRYGVVFSELHSVALADMDGDGLKDIVTGKTYWSHHKQAPQWDAGAVVYWFKLVRGKEGVDWIPYRADGESGIGRQITIKDLNADGLPDIAVGGMKGGYVLIHQAKAVSQEEWQAGQPKVQSSANLVAASSDTRGAKPSFSKEGRIAGAIEGEALTGKPTAGRVLVQPMGSFKADRWSGNSQLWWTGARPDDKLVVDLPEFTGTVDLEVVLTCAKDYGIVQLWLDDQKLGEPIDLYQNNVVTTGLLLFPKIPTQGKTHTLQVQITGANPQAVKSYMFGLDAVRVKKSDGTYVAGPEIKAQKAEAVTLTPDEYPYANVTAERAAVAMKLPAGFHVSVGAAEPDVKQPIAMAIDDRGRIWVAEAYEYPIRAQGEQGQDRILIFEDTDGDGSLNKRKVFAEGLNLVSGLEVGFGGVWIGAAPYLLFIPDANGDDVPDSKPQILLDGWGYQDTHETLNTFIWGPDGWLYGCHGVFTHSKVGKPGIPEEKRVPINAGIWRYHPTRHEFEVFSHGTSNPWGIDFNDHGQAFITACVIPHLYHIIQGARYQRQAGQHFNPHTYRDITTIADHLHYLGATPHSGNSKSDAAGGGHAHAGAMIYLGDRWPEQYRNQLFMNNIHGQRLNVDVLKPRGSGYVGSHAPDFLLTGDQASQILNFRSGPDGNMWMIDWYDMQACHTREVKDHDRSNGRIYKISYGPVDRQAQNVDLKKYTDLELVELVLNKNDWYVRHGRRILQERATQRSIDAQAIKRLQEIAATNADDTRRLRANWALHVTGQFTTENLAQITSDPSPYVRGWAIQLAMESARDQVSPALLAQLNQLARTDRSPIVRLYLASAAQRIPPASRWDLLQTLVSYQQDAGDHNLPLMYWYAAEPLAEVDPTRALALALSADETIPLFREFLLRRIGHGNSSESLAILVNGLGQAQTSDLQLTFLKAIRTALEGQRRVDPPAQWDTISEGLLANSDTNVRMQVTALGVTFGNAAALKRMRSRVTDSASPEKDRLLALKSLLDAKDSGLVPTLLSLLAADAALKEAAIRGLAQYDDPSIGRTLLAAYGTLTPDQRRMALGTLCSRSESGMSLLKAIENKQIPGEDLTADLVQQLRFLKNEELETLLQKVWGISRDSSTEKLAMIAEYKTLINSRDKLQPDLELGRAVFAKTCMKCHILYGVGNKIGPDLTGSNRSDLDYLLSNIVDPSAVMAKEYQSTVIATEDGRIITGLVKAEDERAVTVQTSDALVVVPKGEIEERIESTQSMMPEDQLKQFTPHQVRSLITYLRAKQQSPMLSTAENASSLFNGRDLTGWTGREGLWSVENGELVGRTSGLTKNEWIVSDLSAENFRLTLEVKLVKNAGNSGVQFRSQVHNEEVAGYQADIGASWWGKLYEEHGRGLLWDQSGESHVKTGEWNTYEIVVQGPRIRTFINGQPCIDLNDEKGAVRGIFALQLHSGGPTEVRFRHLKLEVLP